MHPRVTLIGYGEAASTFAESGDWASFATGWDHDPGRQKALVEAHFPRSSTASTALANSPLILSLVTADQALAAAQDYAPLIAPGSIWCDGNSIAPETKRTAAAAIESAGGHYIDCAILAPVNPARLAVPLLLAGSKANDAANALTDLGFTNIRVVGSEVGRASAIKMIRSVMVKGIEALTDEMMAAAHSAGVTDEVLDSLDASERPKPWAERAAYNLERMHTHGLRRAAEMEESAKTLIGLGIEPLMTSGTIVRQRNAAAKAPSA